MRHLAWLHATPEAKGKGDKDRRTRQQRFEADEEAGAERPELIAPEIPAETAYLVDYLMTVGPASGGEVLTFLEIQAWRRETGRILDAWEVETLQKLSRVYLSEYHQASDRDRPPPGGEMRRSKAAATSQMILQMMSQFEAAPGQGPRAG